MLNLIPAPPSGFSGREAELSELHSVLSDRKVIVIAGIGGIGKTALALSFAGSLNKEGTYCNKTAWVQCKPKWDEKDLFTDIFMKIKRIEGVKETGPGTAISADMVAELIERTGTCIFIDDFDLVESDQCLELVNLALQYFFRGKLIISTRKRLSLSPLKLVEIFELRLEGLDLRSTTQLVEKLHLGKQEITDTVHTEIFRKVKGHPFSIKLFLSLLSAGGHSIDSLLTDESLFRAEQERELLDTIWEKLTEQEREIIGYLSVIRVPIKPEGFFFMAEKESKKSLRSLMDKYLVDYNREGLVFINGLIREYCKQNLGEQGLANCHRKLGDFFSSLKTRDIPLLREAYYHYVEAKELDRSTDVILMLGEDVEVLGEETTNFSLLLEHNYCMKREYRSQELLKIRLLLMIFLKQHWEVEELLKNITDPVEHIQIAAEYKFATDQYREAARLYKEALKSTDSRMNRARLYSNLALCHDEMGVIEAAGVCYEKALKEIRDDSSLFVSKIFISYSIYLYNRGEVFQAIDHTRKAAEIAKMHNALGRLGTSYYNLGFYYNAVGEITRAMDSLEKAIETCMKINDLNLLVYIYTLKATIFSNEGKADEAIAIGDEALSIVSDHKWVTEELYTRREMGLLLMKLGRKDEAETHFEKALILMPETDSETDKARTMQNYGQFLYASGNLEKAREFLMKVHAYAEKSDHLLLLTRSSLFLSKTMESLGKITDAEKFKKISEQNSEKLNPQTRREIFKEFKWYEEKKGSASSTGFHVLTQNEVTIAETQESLAAYSGRKENFDIFADCVHRELMVEGNEINLFKKRTLTRLFMEFASNPGKIISAGELFQKVWERDYDPEADAGSFRKTVFRLRSLLSNENKEKYICSAPEKGSYYFNDKIRYCIILEKK